MTTGQLLKTNLGLDNFKSVKIARAVISSYKILFVFYDSYRRTMPVTNYRIKNFPWVAHIFSGSDIYHDTDKQTVFTPATDIEDYNGALRGALIVPVNLAGDRFIDKNQFTKRFESKEKVEPRLLATTPIIEFRNNFWEWVTLSDLANDNSISDFTRTWRKDKNRVNGPENTVAKLIDCIINESDKSVTFQFLTEATELGNKEPNDNIDSTYRFYMGPKGEVDPETFNIKRNRSQTYELSVKILDILDKDGWLSTFEGEKIGSKELKQIFEVSNIQVFSNSPGFHWQGCNVNLSKLDGSIYPTDIPNPVWGPRHGDKSGYFLDKHLFGLIKGFKFWINPMASMLTKKLRQRGLI